MIDLLLVISLNLSLSTIYHAEFPLEINSKKEIVFWANDGFYYYDKKLGCDHPIYTRRPVK